MAEKRLYRKKCESLVEAEETAAHFCRGNIDTPGPGEAWAEEVDRDFFVFIRLAGTSEFDALAAADGYERIE